MTANSNSVFYPKFANGEMLATRISVTGNSNDPPGTKVRFYYGGYGPPGSDWEDRTFKFVWVKSSDHVGHILVSLCKDPNAVRC